MPHKFQKATMIVLSDFTIDALQNVLHERGHKPIAATTILRRFWKSDGQLELAGLEVSKILRTWLAENVATKNSQLLHRHQSGDGTLKLLLKFAAGGSAECVLMPSHRPDRAAACISSQIGCAMGCDFCASTKNGLERNLSVGEIVEQFMHLRRETKLLNRRIASLVFMGMGEPMHNLENVIAAIRLLAARGLGDLGFRAITVSTVGIVPGIERLADENIGVHLALSLHAPDDATRSHLVPTNRRWPVADIIAAAKNFQNRTGRPLNIEYCLLAGVNDSDAQANLLADLMQNFRAHVNLIPYNQIGAGVSGTIYQRPIEERIAQFANLLHDRGVIVHIRRTRGDDVAAACGQLRITSDEPTVKLARR
jgi:23S rRNA (adenine2503-C2)-methyltransferase